ncbi:MAG: hypothetical protein JJE04_11515 [Acidobacteriia bacterium]|nr:hypothetical protein [Terriglobia bacterium]
MSPNPQHKTGTLIHELHSRLTGGFGDEKGGLLRELQSRLERGDEKAGALIRELQSLSLAGFPTREGPPALPAGARDAPTTTALSGIRTRVVEGVAERILRQWGSLPEAKLASLEAEVAAVLIDMVFDQLISPGKGP